MQSIFRKLAGLAVIGVALSAGISGCSMFSPSNAPIDCDVVKTQLQAGQTDAQIASNLGAPVEKVAACHGPATEGNKSAGMAPSNF